MFITLRKTLLSLSILLIFLTSLSGGVMNTISTGEKSGSEAVSTDLLTEETSPIGPSDGENSLRKEVTTVLSPLEVKPKLTSATSTALVTAETFPEPTVKVSEMTDHSLSFYSQEGNDTLRFAMRFTSYDSARLEGWAYLYKDDIQVGTSTHWSDSVASDTEAVALFDFCGYDIYASGINGPYNISLDFQKHNETGTFYVYQRSGDNNNLNYTSKPYLTSDFVMNPVFVNSFTTVNIDSEPNSLYEWLAIDINVDATIVGEYEFDGRLNTNDGSYTQMDNALTRETLSIGSNTVRLKFAGWKLGRITTAVGFNLSLNINHRGFPGYNVYNKDNVYATPVYSASNFDTVPVVVTVLSEQATGGPPYDFYTLEVNIKTTRIEPDRQLHLLASLHGFNVTEPEIDIYTHWNSKAYYMNSLIDTNVTYQFPGNYIEDSNLITMTLVTEFYGKLYLYEYDNWDWHNDDDWWHRGDNLIPEYNSTSTYNYNDFISKGITFTGKIREYGADTDSDGLFNYYDVDVEVQVFQSGTYQVKGDLHRVWDSKHLQHNSVSSYYTPGIYNVTLQYDGYHFYVNVNETIEMWNLQLEDEQNNHLESFGSNVQLNISGMLFDPVPIQLTKITAQDVRMNAEGKIEALIFYIEVEINEVGSYNIGGRLRNPVTGQSYWTNTPNIYYSNIGTHSVELEFPGGWIWSQNTNSSYMLEYVSIYDESGYHWGEINPNFVTSQIYDSNDFIFPPATILSLTETPVNSGGDDRFEYIRFDAQVEVFTAGRYELRIWLSNTEGHSMGYNEFYPGEFNTWQNLDAGIHTLSQYFDSAWISRQSSSQNFTINLVELILENPSTGYHRTVAQIENYGMTRNYDPADFEPPYMLFKSYGNNYGRDADSPGDGIFDYLVFEIQVDVFVEGDYRISGQLRDGSDNELTWQGIFKGHLGTGTHTLQLEFPSYYIHDSYKSQSYYLDHFRIYYDIDANPDNDHWQQIDVIGWGSEGKLYSDVYDYNLFQKAYIYLTHDYTDNGYDSTPSRLGYSGIAVNAGVNVTKSGDYSVQLYFFNSENDDGRWISSSKQWLDPGIHYIAVIIDDTNWLRSQADGTIFKIRHISLYLGDPSGEPYVCFDGTDYTLGIYYRSGYDEPDIKLIGTITETIVDEDGDFSIDAIELSVGIEVTVESAEVWIEVWLGNETVPEMIVARYHSQWEQQDYQRLLSKGQHYLKLRFEARSIYEQKVDYQLYVTEVRVERTDNGWQQTDRAESLYPLSRVIMWNECEASPISLIGVTGETFIDTDSDGLHNYLGITLNVSVREPGDYRANARLQYSDGNGFRNDGIEVRKQLVAGINSFTLYWLGMNFDRDGYTGTWSFDITDLTFTKEKNSWCEIRPPKILEHEHGYYYYYRTSPIDLSQFEHNPVTSAQVVSTSTLDMNSNGKYDLIKADLEIVSTVSGNYWVEAVIADWTDDWDNHLEWRGTAVTLAPGVNTVSLYFSGQRIYDHNGYSRTYAVGNIQLSKYPDEPTVVSFGHSDRIRVFGQEDDWSYLAGSYDHTQFSSQWYEDSNHPDVSSVTINGQTPDSGNIQMTAFSELTVETTITNPEKVSTVYIRLDGYWMKMNAQSTTVYNWQKLMMVSNIGTYGIEVVIEDMYGNQYWSNWFGVDVVEDESLIEIVGLHTDYYSYMTFDDLTLEVTLRRSVTIATVMVEYHGSWFITSKTFENATHEIWAVVFNLGIEGAYDLAVVIRSAGNYEITVMKPIHVSLSPKPTIHSWGIDKGRITLEEPVTVIAYITDNNAVASVRVHIYSDIKFQNEYEDSPFDLQFQELVDGQEMWSREITFYDDRFAGINYVVIEAVDSDGQSVYNYHNYKQLDIINRGSLTIADVQLNPGGPDYDVDSAVEIRVIVWRTSAMVTSVSANANVNNGEYETSLSLDRIRADEENLEEEYLGSMKLDYEGTWIIEIRVMDTRNSIATESLTINVKGDGAGDQQFSSGIEMDIILASLIPVVVVALIRRKRK
ncbi:MAG: hypothetical protein ACFFD4_18795 [Candidatus Odinarchaeota archaeon]